jgi:hypothetical protein
LCAAIAFTRISIVYIPHQHIAQKKEGILYSGTRISQDLKPDG